MPSALKSPVSWKLVGVARLRDAQILGDLAAVHLPFGNKSVDVAPQHVAVGIGVEIVRRRVRQIDGRGVDGAQIGDARAVIELPLDRARAD